MKRAAISTTKTFFSICNHIAPIVAVRAAEKIFTTPFHSKRRDIEHEMLERADKFTIPFNENRDLAAYRWGKKSDPVVLFVHGWTSTATCFLSFIDPLVARGYQVISYDALAHGASPGRSVSMTEWADMLLAALKAIGPVHCITGHSLGGSAIVLASSLELPTNKIVLLSAMSNIFEVTEKFARTLNISPKVIEGMHKYAWKKYEHSASRYGNNWNDVFNSSFKVPSLIIHDKNDKEIHWRNSEAIAKQWPWAEFELTENLGHRRILLDPEVVSLVIDFIDS